MREVFEEMVVVLVLADGPVLAMLIVLWLFG